uniref:SAM domain-containing protein n=1 Tax=Poecilia mexicana TaxID=48701 RepID=A0A3B3Z3Z9_9TELE
SHIILLHSPHFLCCNSPGNHKVAKLHLGRLHSLGIMSELHPVSSWSVEEVLEWIQEQHPGLMETLYKGIIKHDISGRALLRLREHHLQLLGVEDDEQQQEILQDLLLLRVQEEINELNDICSASSDISDTKLQNLN